MSRISYYFLLIIQLFVFSFYSTSANILDPKWDPPTERELYKYLSAVENVVHFCVEHEDQTDINLTFGLFIVNLNLAHAVQQKKSTIPQTARDKIKSIIHINSKIMKMFKQSAMDKEIDLEYSLKALDILSLFNNESFWSKRLKRFFYTAQNQYTSDELENMYSPFSMYMRKVDQINKWIPNPKTSDICLASLSNNPRNSRRLSPKCVIKDFCYDILRDGTNFGYSLTHRLLILLMARFGRGCTIFSRREDKALVKHFCSKAHAEATYIAENNFGLADLLMEIILLCAVDGHSQFIRRDWLDNLLQFQTPEGCYGAMPYKNDTLARRTFFQTKMVEHDNLLSERCVVHTNAVAAAAFSAAVRFIIEEYY